MRNWKKWVCLTAAGMAFFMAGCGKEAAVSTEAPLVKTVVAGEAAKGEKTSFSVRCMGISNLLWLSRQEDALWPGMWTRASG